MILDLSNIFSAVSSFGNLFRNHTKLHESSRVISYGMYKISVVLCDLKKQQSHLWLFFYSFFGTVCCVHFSSCSNNAWKLHSPFIYTFKRWLEVMRVHITHNIFTCLLSHFRHFCVSSCCDSRPLKRSIIFG